MADLQSLQDLARAGRRPAGPCPEARQRGRAYATGKRKNAVARVWVSHGGGRILVNDKDFTEYFARPVLQMVVQQPIIAANRNGQYDVRATVSGGGLSGPGRRAPPRDLQGAHLLRAGAPRLLKKEGFLTRDSRVVERKKYGKRKARRSFQFSKR